MRQPELTLIKAHKAAVTPIHGANPQVWLVSLFNRQQLEIRLDDQRRPLRW